MLTDIFATRYEDRIIWPHEERVADRALLVQGFRMLNEQLFPSGDSQREAGWTAVQGKLSMELGLESLEPLYWKDRDEKLRPHSMDSICKVWMLRTRPTHVSVDTYMKQRVSLIEIAFRERMQQVYQAKSEVQNQAARLAEAASDRHQFLMPFLVSREAVARRESERVTKQYDETREELNERFRRAKLPLTYHNGFIQIESNAQTEEVISKPFWALIAHPRWKNVEIDMMEAVDRRESAQRDPALYAAKALESVLKIVSDEKGWTTGKERGASNYIDNLRSTKNGAFIAEWEAEAMRIIFGKIRNELGHGPGAGQMITLTQHQTNWVIENAMSWTKSLVERM